jgi:hypothetical protein
MFWMWSLMNCRFDKTWDVVSVEQVVRTRDCRLSLKMLLEETTLIDLMALVDISSSTTVTDLAHSPFRFFSVAGIILCCPVFVSLQDCAMRSEDLELPALLETGVKALTTRGSISNMRDPRRTTAAAIQFFLDAQVLKDLWQGVKTRDLFRVAVDVDIILEGVKARRCGKYKSNSRCQKTSSCATNCLKNDDMLAFLVLFVMQGSFLRACCLLAACGDGCRLVDGGCVVRM